MSTNRFAHLTEIQPDAPNDVPRVSAERIDAVAEQHGFVSREPAVKRKRATLEGPTEQLNMRVLLDDRNAFIGWMEENRFRSQKEAFHELMKLAARAHFAKASE